jgi:hypothetical protein
MALIGLNGGLIGKQRSAFTVIAPGLWTANEQVMLKRAGLWLPASDPDAAAYIAAVEAADGQLLEDGVKSAINTFVVGCKADGIWTALKASCILAGARTLSGALVPLVGTAPTNNNFVSGDYNRETGLVGDGSTKYLDSNRNNNADPQNSKHLSCYITQAGTLNAILMSTPTVNNNGDAYLYIQTTPTVLINQQIHGVTSGPTPYSTASNPTGFYGASRANSTDHSARANSTAYTVTTPSAAPSSGNIFVIGGFATLYSNQRLAFYSIGESLDLALLDTRVTTLINAIAAAIP